MRILDDDEQPETDTWSADMTGKLSGRLSAYQLLQKCADIRTQFKRKSRKQCFVYSQLCHFLFITLEKYHSLSTSLHVERSELHKTSISEKSIDSVIYMTGSSTHLYNQEISEGDSTNSEPEGESTSSVTDAPVLSTTSLQGNVLESTSVQLAEESTVSQHTSAADDTIIQTGSTEMESETVLSTSSVEVQSKTMSENGEASSIDSQTIQPTPTLVSTESSDMVSITTQIEATPSLPSSWKPDTKDLMTEATRTENQESNTKVSSTNVSLTSGILVYSTY